jgi:hypothetical protein
MSAEEWSSAFTPLDEEKQPLSGEHLPLRITLATKRPAYRRLFISGLDGILRRIDVACIPICGLQGEFLGAAALFWELPQQCA